MAGVDFNREVFAKTSEAAPRPAQRGAGLVILAVVLGLLAFLGYKILSESRLLPSDHGAQSRCHRGRGDASKKRSDQDF